MRLIDADALLASLDKGTEHNAAVVDKRIVGQILTIQDIINNAPTVQREGWVSVPIEPTDEMLRAGCEAGLDIKTLMDDEPFATDKAVYKAMIKTYINK